MCGSCGRFVFSCSLSASVSSLLFVLFVCLSFVLLPLLHDNKPWSIAIVCTRDNLSGFTCGLLFPSYHSLNVSFSQAVCRERPFPSARFCLPVCGVFRRLPQPELPPGLHHSRRRGHAQTMSAAHSRTDVLRFSTTCQKGRCLFSSFLQIILLGFLLSYCMCSRPLSLSVTQALSTHTASLFLSESPLLSRRSVCHS